MHANEQPQPTVTASKSSASTDYDEPYTFGRTPRASAPYPFSTRQFARLLVLRSRVQAGQFAADDLAAS
jgi:hypothetical protein